jgi:hypothetical protein
LPYLSGRVPAYLQSKLIRPLATKDGHILRTVLGVRAYMLALPKHRELRSQWQRAAALLLESVDTSILSRQVELALFYDAQLDLAKV